MFTVDTKMKQREKFHFVLKVLSMTTGHGVEIPPLEFDGPDKKQIKLLMMAGPEIYTKDSELIKVSSDFSSHLILSRMDKEDISHILNSKQMDYGMIELKKRLIDLLSPLVEQQNPSLNIPFIISRCASMSAPLEIFGITYETSGHNQFQDETLFEDFKEARDHLIRKGYREQNRIFIKPATQFGAEYKAYIEPRKLVKVGD